MPYFDRFDICEAWSVWAHDWGEYEVITRLNNLGFSFGAAGGFYHRLEDNGKAIYDALNARSEADPDWYHKARASKVQP